MNGMILFLCLIWGFNFVIMKSANGLFPPVLFAAFRFLMGAAVLFVVVYLKKIPLPSKKNLKWYILCGLLQTTYFNLAIQISLNYISAGLVSVLTYSMPLFFCILAHFFYTRRRIDYKKNVGNYYWYYRIIFCSKHYSFRWKFRGINSCFIICNCMGNF